jgi:hypothetical protein
LINFPGVDGVRNLTPVPDTSVIIALTGGTGAAIGAGVGQLVQWWRERLHASVEERRRDEDRRDALERERLSLSRETYLNIINQCIDFRLYLSDLIKEIDAFGAGDLDGFRKMWSAFARDATSRSREIFRLATTHGSNQIHAAAEKIHYENYDLWEFWVANSFELTPELLNATRSRYSSLVRSISTNVNGVILAAREEMYA